jgi:hypothetical protein
MAVGRVHKEVHNNDDKNASDDMLVNRALKKKDGYVSRLVSG